jgi:hypothetical protein
MDNNSLREALKFLQRVQAVFGQNAFSYIVRLDLPGQRLPNHKAVDIRDTRAVANGIIHQSKRDPTNGLFFTPFSFSAAYHPEGGNLRKHDEYKVACQCFWLDIDVGENKHYPTLKEALTACLTATVQCPPNILVDSGGGLHAYWVANRPIPLAGWLIVARQFKQWFIDLGIRGDLGITPDSGRVLRLPGTANMKTGTPRACRVLKDDGASYGWTAMSEFLPEASNLDTASQGTITSLFGGATETMVDEADRRPSYTAEIVKKCLVLNAVGVSRGKDDDEPLWKDVLGVIARTEDAEVYAHVLSDGHPDYHEVTVNQKLAERAEQKPITCAQLGQSYVACHGNDLCASCPHSGTIKSPISLGYKEAEPEELPCTIPFPLELRADGTYLHLKDKDGKKGIQRVMGQRLLSARAVRGHDTHGDYIQKLLCDVELLSHTEERAFDIEELTQHKSRKAGHFAKNGMVIGDGVVDTVASGIKSWYTQLVEAGKAVEPILHLGWFNHSHTTGYSGFATGGDAIMRDPNDVLPYLKLDDSLINSYVQHGDIAPWGLAVEQLMEGGVQELMVPVYTSFASILTPFNSDPAAVVNIFTDQSGVGKTTAMQVAAAVWGNPKSIMNSMNDTVNSVANRAANIHNLPLFWDEVRGGDEHDRGMMEFIFRIPQGRSKERMTGDGGRTNTFATYRLMAVLASNEPIITNAIESGSDAAVARIFSVELPPGIKYDDQTKRHAFSDLIHNYGHAGVEFARFVASHQTEVRALCRKLDDSLRVKHKPKAADRMLITTMAQLTVAATILRNIGLVNNDVLKFLQCLEHHYARMITLHKRMETQTRSVIPVEQYLNAERVNGMVVTELQAAKRGKPKDREDKIVDPPMLGGGTLQYELCSKTGEVLVNRTHFQQWAHLNITGFKPSSWERRAQHEGVLLDREARRRLGSGTRHSTKTPHYCYHIQLPDVGSGGRVKAVAPTTTQQQEKTDG